MAGFVALGVWQLRAHAREAGDARRRAARARAARSAAAVRSRLTPPAAAPTTGRQAKACSPKHRRSCSTTSSTPGAAACAPIACSSRLARRDAVAGRTRLVAVARRSPHAAGRRDRRAGSSSRPAGAAACAWHRQSRPPAQQPDGTLLATSLDASDAAGRRSDKRSWRRACCAWIRRNPLGFARDLDVLPNTLPPERHLGYAVQWFALALAVLVTALVLTLPQRSRTIEADPMNDASQPATPQRNRLVLLAILALFFGSLIVAGVLRFSGWQPAGTEEQRRTAAAARRPARSGAEARRWQRLSHGIPAARLWRIVVAPPAGLQRRLRRARRANSTPSGSCSARMPTACTSCGSARRLPAQCAMPRHASSSPSARLRAGLPRSDGAPGEATRPARRAGLRDRSEWFRGSALRSRLRSGGPARGPGQAAETEVMSNDRSVGYRPPHACGHACGSQAFPPHRLARGRAGGVRDRVRRVRAPVQCRPELPGLADLLRPRRMAAEPRARSATTPPPRSARSKRTRPGASSSTACSPARSACWCSRWRCWPRAGGAHGMAQVIAAAACWSPSRIPLYMHGQHVAAARSRRSARRSCCSPPRCAGRTTTSRASRR